MIDNIFTNNIEKSYILGVLSAHLSGHLRPCAALPLICWSCILAGVRESDAHSGKDPCVHPYQSVHRYQCVHSYQWVHPYQVVYPYQCGHPD